MPRVTDPYERQHIANLARYGKLIDDIFRAAVQEAARIGAIVGGSNFDASRVFSFADYPITQGMVQSLLSRLANSVETAIVNGVEAEWTLANNKNSALSRRVFGDNVGRLTQAQYRRYFSTNDDARQAFLGRKEQGLNLSERVWNYAQGFKNDIELGLDLGIRNGLDADAMSRELRQFLRYPDKLFRRVRDEHGNLVLSQRAADFHPGQGVYRSSYKNARRLAVTETNMAYRTADYERMQQLDFIVGIEIRLSNNHTCNGVPLTDICDNLCGRYPKDFKFTGWHPHCRCHVVQILKTEAELMEENRAILNGEEPSQESANRVDDVPQAFKDWVEENEQRLGKARSVPYFIKDNSQIVARVIHDCQLAYQPTVEKLEVIQQAKEVLKQVTINDIKQEFEITGESNIAKSSVLQFDLLGLKNEVRLIAEQFDFDVDIANVHIYQNGNWAFTIQSRKMEYSKSRDNTIPSFTLRRSFRTRQDGTIEVEHDFFALIDRIQGQGISKRLFRNMYVSYKKMGVRHLTVFANIDGGGYTWTKYGFCATNKTEVDFLIERIQIDKYEKLCHEIVDNWYKSNGFSEDTPFPMWLIGNQPWARTALGGQCWQGVLDFKNTEQLAIWEKYLGIK